MTTYYVWRRGDGYVSSTCYSPTGSDFDILLVTDGWDEAKAAIVAARDDRHFATVAGWTQCRLKGDNFTS